jgi:phosphoribosylformylglycinamidine cyclo-ligase
MDYKTSGVNIDLANSTKAEFKKIIDTDDPRVLNKVGAFASLFDLSRYNIKNPVLVTKTEEPGSKQLLCFQHDNYESISHDMINHLVNDCIMMGAHPLIVQDCIVCGKFEKDKIKRMVSAMADACRYNMCKLVGGETSEQPGVIPEGTYILSSSIVGIVDKKNIIDGSKIKEGDDVIAISSSGPHTNGYTLIRTILKDHPELYSDFWFLDNILSIHRAYYWMLRKTFPYVRGLAHITGGGISENLDRILPHDLDAVINLDDLRILPIFKKIRKIGGVPDSDMLRTFNLGVGVTAVVNPKDTEGFIREMLCCCDTYKIGTIVRGSKKVNYEGVFKW